MTKTQYNPPVTISLYLGSGRSGMMIRENLAKRVPPRGSLSEVILELLKKADPGIFKGAENGNKRSQ